MREMRRQDRCLTERETLEIIRQGEYGVLSTVTVDGTPYGVPISYALDEENSMIYFHGTNQPGQKTENLAHQPKGCLTIVAHTELMPEKFATKYLSANVFGSVVGVDDDQEKRYALELILKKYSPDYLDQGAKYMEGAMSRVGVMKMKIDCMTGKARKK